MGSSRFSEEIDPVNEAGSRGIRVAVNHRIGEAGTSLYREKKKGKEKEIAMNEIFTRNRLVTCTYTMRSCINLAFLSFLRENKSPLFRENSLPPCVKADLSLSIDPPLGR